MILFIDGFFTRTKQTTQQDYPAELDAAKYETSVRSELVICVFWRNNNYYLEGETINIYPILSNLLKHNIPKRHANILSRFSFHKSFPMLQTTVVLY